MTDRELMQQALDALEHCAPYQNLKTPYFVIEALRARLAQPEQEPEMWVHDERGWVGLHSHPKREWVGLADEELAGIYAEYKAPRNICLAIESALREKNT